MTHGMGDTARQGGERMTMRSWSSWPYPNEEAEKNGYKSLSDFPIPFSLHALWASLWDDVIQFQGILFLAKHLLKASQIYPELGHVGDSAPSQVGDEVCIPVS